MTTDVTALTQQARDCLARVLLDFGCCATRDHANELIDQDRDLRLVQEHMTMAFVRYRALMVKNYDEGTLGIMERLVAFLKIDQTRYMQLLSRYQSGNLRRRASLNYKGVLFVPHEETNMDVNFYWSEQHQLLMPKYQSDYPIDLCHPATIPGAPGASG